jgi:hypothetical protein
MSKMSTNTNPILKNILATLFGVFVMLAAIGAFFVVLIFIKPKGSSLLLDMVILGVPCFSGGFATSSTAANLKLLCTCILCILSLLILGAWLKFNLTDNSHPKNYLEFFIIIISCLLGGIAGSKRKSL